MTKVIKEEFEKLESLKISDVSLTCNTSLKIFNEEFNRMSRMDDDLFTYEVEITEASGDDEVELTDEESFDYEDEDKVAKIFRIETNVFDFETPFWRDDGYCNGGNLPGAYIVGNALHYQDFEWYKALKDSKLKEEALKNKAILEGIIEDEDDESSNEGCRRWNVYENTNHGHEER
ncbi:hypothetical protein Tco_0467505 [Tanacetum coccineum]